MSKLTAFISGHLDLTTAEFEKYYKPKIDQALNLGHHFVVGDARGADSLAQRYLRGKFTEVKVFHAYKSPRNNWGNYATEGNFVNQTQKDSAMTENSDYDIAWVRPGREDSGTARNIQRRQKLAENPKLSLNEP